MSCVDEGAGRDPAARLYTAAAVRELDRRAIEDLGIDGYVLMQAAGAAAFRLLRLRWPGARSLVIVCGGGNNGGDGLVIGRLALEAGMRVSLALTREPGGLAGSAALAWRDYVAAGGERTPAGVIDPGAGDLIVDALLGTGLDREVHGMPAHLIERINADGEAGRPVLAIDVPSGLDADSGAVLGAGVRASATITFIGRKRGLYTGDAPARTGPVFLDRLGTPDSIHADLEPWIDTVSTDHVVACLPRRLPTDHKGRAGRVVVVGGNLGMGGAARLAGEAALRSGAGLVTLITRACHAAALSGARPELMAHGIEEPARELPGLLSGADAVIMGPGLGQDAWAREAWQTVRREGPANQVLDADGLNLLAMAEDPVTEGGILTPHPGEAARLLKTAAADIERDRFAALTELVDRTAATVVLKGAGSLVGAPAARPGLIPAANPAMATGGTGDVLAGLIGGLLGQGMEPAPAAACGAWLHARAGVAAADGHDCGMIASDLLGWIGRLRADPRHG